MTSNLSLLLNTVFRRQTFAHIDLSHCHGIGDIARSSTARELDEALGAIGSERWLQVCPQCGGEEMPKGQSCQLCQGIGRVPVYKS